MNGKEFMSINPEDFEKMNQKAILKIIFKSQRGLYERICDINKNLFDPDQGVYSRVAANTRWRKAMLWMVSILVTLIVLNITIQFI